MVLSFQRVTPIVSHPLTRPDDLGVTYGPSRQTDARKPHYHRRFGLDHRIGHFASMRPQRIERITPNRG
jgi:hypothetical protein